MRSIFEKVIEGLFKFCGSISIIVILLITFFLFKEGMGLFNTSVVESGYALCLHPTNRIETLTSFQIKEIFDYEIENWKDVGGDDLEIRLFRFEEIFNYYSDEELGDDYSLLPEKLAEEIEKDETIIAFIPQKYVLEESDKLKVLKTGDISLNDFFGGHEWMPTSTPTAQFGALPLILGTLWVSFFAILIALPLGMGVAIYMSELAGKRIRSVMKPAIELLAGIPSVVYGFFGLIVLVPLIQQTFNLPVGETAFAGSIVLAIMALPTIITVAEDAMRTTPAAMREASLSLGANQWQTIYRVVIPYASSGISAAVILGIGRAIGETMAVLMVTGNAAVMPSSLFEPIRTIPATIAAELGEAPTGGTHYKALFLLGCILFVITLAMSIFAEMVSKKQHNKGI
ncbi:MAG: phosphate ABC transporter permease subunit PstC [Prolixibacteraceae bacterium]|nr:phosphate ABC transporter permease subunit PstC [Prolixibacteraceae bacterium]